MTRQMKLLKTFFKSLLNRYQNDMQISMRGSDFIFDCIHLLYYKCHKINPNCGGLYMNSPHWIKSKKSAINSINEKHNKYSQQAVTAALNKKEIGKDHEKGTNINFFISKCNCEKSISCSCFKI